MRFSVFLFFSSVLPLPWGGIVHEVLRWMEG